MMLVNLRDMAEVLEYRTAHCIMSSMGGKQSKFSSKFKIKILQKIFPMYSHLCNDYVDRVCHVRHVDIDHAIQVYRDALENEYYKRFRKAHKRNLKHLIKVKEYYDNKGNGSDNAVLR